MNRQTQDITWRRAPRRAALRPKSTPCCPHTTMVPHGGVDGALGPTLLGAMAVIDGEVVASRLDREIESHAQLSQVMLERCRHLAEIGNDEFLVLDRKLAKFKSKREFIDLISSARMID